MGYLVSAGGRPVRAQRGPGDVDKPIPNSNVVTSDPVHVNYSMRCRRCALCLTDQIGSLFWLRVFADLEIVLPPLYFVILGGRCQAADFGRLSGVRSTGQVFILSRRFAGLIA